MRALPSIGLMLSLTGALFFASCSDDAATGGGGAAVGGGGAAPVKVTPAPYGQPYETLGEWNLFADVAGQVPADRVVAYDVASPLFSDYAAKWRFLFVPEGQTIGYDDESPWEFPVGTILVKTFGYLADPQNPAGARRLLETRLLYKEPDGWSAHTYVYDDTQQQATRTIAGKFIQLTFTKPSGEQLESNYHVPNTNECKDCHVTSDVVVPLGPRARQLDRTHDYGAGLVNQLDHLVSLGLLDRAPGASRRKLVDPFDPAAGTLEYRVRSYFDANCAHCHTTGGSASQSALLLDLDSTDPAMPRANWGVCKVPTSASDTCGNVFDVVPGAPEESILVCRLSSSQLDTRMPPLGSAVIHDEGVALVSEWIAAMPAETCQ